jgi:hypothetical protein
MEHVAGVESLVGWVQRECAGSLREAKSWRQLHAVASSKGLSIRPRGNGLVFIAADGPAIKASSVAREFSLTALERRLGPFEAASTTQVGRTSYARNPLPALSSDRLHQAYRVARQAAVERKRALAGVTAQAQQQERLKIRHVSKRRWSAIRLVAHGRVGWALWASYARAADRSDRQRLRERQKQLTSRTIGAQPPSSWLGWLRERSLRGDDDALQLLRNRRERSERVNAIVSTSPAPRAPQAEQRVGRARGGESVTLLGTIVHYVHGGSIRDDGTRLHLRTADPSDEATEWLLRMSIERYGRRLGVEGDRAFREAVARVAAERRLPIEFVDRDVEARRVELEGRYEHDDPERRRPRASARPIGKEGEGRASLAAARRGLQSDAHRSGRKPPTQPDARVRGVSELDVVRFEGRRQGVLPGDALAHVDQRRTGCDRSVRRHPVPDQLKQSKQRNRGIRR